MKTIASFFLIMCLIAVTRGETIDIPRLLRATDGCVEFKAYPPSLLKAVDYRFLALGNYQALYARYGEELLSRDFGVGELTIDGKIAWRRRLVNRVFPSYAILIKTNEGVLILTLGDYFMRKDSSAAMVLYSQRGSILMEKRLDEIFSHAELESIFGSAESKDVFRAHEIKSEPLRIQVTVNDSVREIPLMTSQAGESEVNLQSRP